MKFTVFKKLPAWFAGLVARLDGNKKWLTLSVVALAATAAIIALLWGGDDYIALYGVQENLPVAQIISVLDGEKLDYRIDPTDGQILVPKAALSKTRMALAAKGVQALAPAGYELMDQDEILGSSQFIQDVRYKRSLEGEMAQSIMTLDAVAAARVHLALNEASSFVVSDTPQNSASVVVRLRYGMRLNADQVNAIVHLVSGSVPGLKADRVSVVDQAGELLSEGVGDGARAAAAMRKNDRIMRDIQQKTRDNMATLLTSLVGRDNFRISVMPELDLSAVDETQERLGDTPKINNEQNSEDRNTDRLALGIPGALSNRPPPPANATANAASPAQAEPPSPPQALSQHKESKRDYAYDRDVQHIQHPDFTVKRLSVAVVLNQNAPGVQGWTPAQIQQVSAMLGNAAGIDGARGDKFSMTLMKFLPPQRAVDIAPPWWQNDAVLSWGRLGASGLLSLLLLLLVIRPIVKSLAGARRERQTPELGVMPAPVVGPAQPPALESADGQIAPSVFPDDGDNNLPPQSSGLEIKLEYLRKLALNDTDRVAEVIRQWITSNERIDVK